MVEALTWTTATFVIGGMFLLERRGLGQIALAHPLVLCLIVGYVAGQEEICLWIGISLQLMSVGQGHSVNWALVGIAAAVTIAYVVSAGVIIVPGDPSSLAVIVLTVPAGIGSSLLERRQARLDGEMLRCHPIWDNTDPARALEKLIHRRLLRGFITGGIQSVLVSAVTILVVFALQRMDIFLTPLTTIAALFVPILGAAAAVGSLARRRFIVYAGASLLATLALMVLI